MKLLCLARESLERVEELLPILAVQCAPASRWRVIVQQSLDDLMLQQGLKD
jgi:hypothetical protein